MNARSLLPWSMGIPPKPRDDFRDFEMISGEDPYDWKGKEEILIPFLRSEDPEQTAKIFGELFQNANS
ncbi:MAG: hypothetical protein AAF292_16975 [Pseudomonadota bacterium]